MPEQKFPHPTAGALIVNPKGKILLLKSHKWKNMFTIPGGHIELGETIEQALKREVKEETGLEISGIEFLMVQDFIFGENYCRKRHFVFINFSAKTGNAAVKLNEEAEEYTWATPAEARKLPVEPYTMKVIEEYEKKILKTP